MIEMLCTTENIYCYNDLTIAKVDSMVVWILAPVCEVGVVVMFIEGPESIAKQVYQKML